MAFLQAGQYSGGAQPSTNYRVFALGSTTLATLYTDKTKATVAPAVVTSDDDGFLSFFADPGNYSVIVVGFETALAKARVFPNLDVVVPLNATEEPTGRTVLASTTASQSVDFTASNFFDVTLSAATTTFVVANPPAAGDYTQYVFELRQGTGGGKLVTWPTGTKWAAGVAPTLTVTAAAIDVIMLVTGDGGTTYLGSVMGQAYA